MATAEPETEAIRHELITDALAGPPTLLPVRARATLMKKRPAPDRTRMAPKRMNRKM